MAVSRVLVFVYLCVQIVVGQFGFFSNERMERRFGNFLPNKRIRQRLSSLMHVRPQTPDNDPYVYPFNNRPEIPNNGYYEQYPYEGNQGYYPNYDEQYYGRPPARYPSYYAEEPNNYHQNTPVPSKPYYDGEIVYGRQPQIPNGNSKPVTFPDTNGKYEDSDKSGRADDSTYAVNFPANDNIHYESIPISPISTTKTEEPVTNLPPLTPVPTSVANKDLSPLSPVSAEIESAPFPKPFITSPSESKELPSLTPVPTSKTEVPSFESPTSKLPPPASETDKEIPPIRPPGSEPYRPPFNIVPSETKEIPKLNPVPNTNGAPPFGSIPSEVKEIPQESDTGLKALTPVPTSSRDNHNSGTRGIFKETCQTVDGGPGSCLSVFSCQPYLALLQQSQSNPEVVQVLRKAHCGFEGNNPKVCCPRPGIPTVPPSPHTVPTSAPPTAPTPAPSVTELSGKSTQEGDLEDYVSAFPDPPVCGFSNATFTRVVGGIPAKLGDFPWMALLGYVDRRTQAARWLCGGSLITSRHVLTAAHCINGHEVDLQLVRLGELDLGREDDGAAPVDIYIKSKIKHEKYNPNAFTDDIGLLVLAKEVKFTNMIRPICIPRDNNLRSNTFENYTPLVAGWGQLEFRGQDASHLQVVQLPVVSNEFCAQAYSSYKAQVIDERVVCAGYKKGGKDACKGDSGGPLMQPIWNNQDFTTHFYQIGVVSYGKKCAEPGFPGVYTRVTEFVPWLDQHVLGKA